MKKMKKILAMLLALTMLMGLGMTAMAVEDPEESETPTYITVPSGEDKAEIKVTGLPEAVTTVTAYQIVDADYYDADDEEVGFKEYIAVSGVSIGDPTKPTAAEVAEIANDIALGNITTLVSKPLSKNGDGSFSTQAEAGYWLVIVNPVGHHVFNPMLAGVYYENTNGSGNTITGGTIDSTKPWKLNGVTTVAKQSETTVEKEIVNPSTGNKLGDDVAIGEDIQYKVTADIPVYSEEMYKDVTFKVTDTLGEGISFLDNSNVTVKVSGNESALVESENTYTASINGQVLTVDFADRFVFDNGGKEVTITYMAELNENALHDNNPNDNEVELIYTRKPGEDTTSEPKITHHYTFDVDFKKLDANNKATALEEAEFTLYKNAECTQVYTNDAHPDGKVTSGRGGSFTVKGLDSGSYYLKETKAPTGYQLDNTVHKLDVHTKFASDGTLEAYEIVFDEGLIVETYKAGATSNAQPRIIEITNTKLIALPSTGGIGTTIFTVAGCGIMIAAAFFFFASRKKENE